MHPQGLDNEIDIAELAEPKLSEHPDMVGPGIGRRYTITIHDYMYLRRLKF